METAEPQKTYCASSLVIFPASQSLTSHGTSILDPANRKKELTRGSVSASGRGNKVLEDFKRGGPDCFVPTPDLKFVTSASPTGYVNSEMFYDYFENFVFPDLDEMYGVYIRKRLFLDLHSTHLTEKFMTLLEAKNTALCSLFPMLHT